MTRTLFALVAWCAVLAWTAEARAGARIKDITDLEGARSNQLYGFGLVIGLNGTGGSSLFTQQVAVDMMKYFCVNAKIVQQVQTDNVFRSRSVSAVIVTAEIGPFARIGSRLDVTVSILDNASSLQGARCCLHRSREPTASSTRWRKDRCQSAAFSSGGRRPAPRRTMCR
jgi:flagellar P-ring protein precursor FlgI